MFRTKSPSDPALWEALRTELRRARGHNLLRARQAELPEKGEVLLQVESRNTDLAGQRLHIRVGRSMEETVFRIGDTKRAAAEAGSMAAFVEEIAAICRGYRPYIRTDDEVAAYKK